MSLNEFYKFRQNRCVTVEALEHSDKYPKYKLNVALVAIGKNPPNIRALSAKKPIIYISAKLLV